MRPLVREAAASAGVGERRAMMDRSRRSSTQERARAVISRNSAQARRKRRSVRRTMPLDVMWTTAPMLPDALECRRLGVDYRAHFVWIKAQRSAPEYWTRKRP